MKYPDKTKKDETRLNTRATLLRKKMKVEVVVVIVGIERETLTQYKLKPFKA